MSRESQEMEKIFETANEQFLQKNYMLFNTKVSERVLCGALMLELYNVIAQTKYSDYFVDVEYNRNGSKLKTIIEDDMKIVTINCDLILHSRGQNLKHDNLIAIEMKKSTAKESDKNKDRIRLKCLTKLPDQDVWSCDGETLPHYVCGYKLGVYYEVNFKQKTIQIEYYANGHKYSEYKLNFETSFITFNNN